MRYTFPIDSTNTAGLRHRIVNNQVSRAGAGAPHCDFGDSRRGYRLGVEWNSCPRLTFSREHLEADDTAPPHGMLFKGEMRL